VTIAVRGFCALVLASLLALPASASAQESKSATLAGELSKLLDAAKLDSVAARQTDSVFVGALYFPGTQLLVVGGNYSAPDRLNYLLGQKAYKDVYADLSSASEQKGKIFIMDLGADGLRFRREDNQPFDVADVAGKSINFDGDWGRARISEDEYRKSFQTADERYVQMLQALIDALKKSS
jgi:hypothetical protein